MLFLVSIIHSFFVCSVTTYRGEFNIQLSTFYCLLVLVAVVVAFFICWIPFHSQRLMFVVVTLYGEWTIPLQQVSCLFSKIMALTLEKMISQFYLHNICLIFCYPVKCQILQCLPTIKYKQYLFSYLGSTCSVHGFWCLLLLQLHSQSNSLHHHVKKVQKRF